MDALNIEKGETQLNREPRGEFQDINGWTNVNFSCLEQNKNSAGS